MSPRLAAYGLITAALALAATFVWITVAGWRADSLALPGVQMRLAATLAAQETANRFRAARSQEIAADEKRLADTAARLPPQPVRLCRNPAPAAPAAGAGSQGAGAAAAGGVVPGAVGEDPLQGPDVGPDVRALLMEAERVAAVARAAQADLVEVRKLAAEQAP